MRKSQIITLIILLIAVTLFIWIGACSDKKEPENPSRGSVQFSSQTPTADNNTPAPPTETPAQTLEKPNVDLTQLEGLGADALNTEASEDGRSFSDAAASNAVAGADYILSRAGTDTKDIYMAFMLDSSDSNPMIIKILDSAKSKNAKFTFYVSKNYISDPANTELIKRMKNEGHTIGNRGDLSANQLTMSAEELRDSLWSVELKYQEIFGNTERMYFYSPDTISQRNIKLANLMGYTVTFRRSKFATDEGTRPETYNGVLFQAVNIKDTLPDQTASFVDWGISEGYTFKRFTK